MAVLDNRSVAHAGAGAVDSTAHRAESAQDFAGLAVLAFGFVPRTELLLCAVPDHVAGAAGCPIHSYLHFASDAVGGHAARQCFFDVETGYHASTDAARAAVPAG